MAIGPDGAGTLTETSRPNSKMEMLTGDYKQLTLRNSSGSKKEAKTFEELNSGLVGFCFADCEDKEEYSLIYECDDLNNVPKIGTTSEWEAKKGQPVFYVTATQNFSVVSTGGGRKKAGFVIDDARIAFRGAMGL